MLAKNIKIRTAFCCVMMKVAIVSLLLILSYTSLEARDKSPFGPIEDSLISLSNQILTAASDEAKDEANEEFSNLLFEVLGWKEAFHYPFVSLTMISKVWSPDHSFRIFTWYVPYSDGTFEYGGIIHVKGRHRFYRFMLNDVSATMKDPLRETGSHNHWYGAVYSDIIHTKHRGRDYYTLLGWDGNNAFTNKKVIEVLTLKGDIKPSFGNSLFKSESSKTKRILFEYSEQATMLLKYDEQLLTYTKRRILRVPFISRNRGGSAVKSKKVSEKMIVFDRLVPLHTSLEGHYEYYVPATNIIDALIWRDGKWYLARDIDARNPETTIERRRNKPTPPKDGLFPKE